ncbi:hypothetical protein PENSPDRAFT_112229 [Peniophora sp. CONT]|nr:hypothetical protein PENSPDRAFT_112229 [Peniophora sp. CONT]
MTTKCKLQLQCHARRAGLEVESNHQQRYSHQHPRSAPMPSEFASRSVLTVQVTPATNARQHRTSSFSFEILKPYEPFTAAVVAKVAVGSAARQALGILDTTAVLKLFDRRCYKARRTELSHRAIQERPHTIASECAYRKFVCDLQAGSVTLTKDINCDTWFICRERAPIGEFELALQRSAERAYRKEVRAYQRLSDYQGSVIPRMYGTVQYTAKIPLGGNAYAEEVISGILLEHISDVTLERFATDFSASRYSETPQVLAGVCRRAMEVSTHFWGIGALNDDAHMNNMLVREPLLVPSRTGPQLSLSPCCVVMIDFEFMKFRDDYDSEEAFQRSKLLTGMHEIGPALERIVPSNVWRYVYEEWETPPKRII